ncbi:hypothetical protein Leryth_023004 [Lithospermum erythrorhizon]|nr:hypothetical protein Leryth_023004 [Lithospermum erythrorhizon]
MTVPLAKTRQMGFMLIISFISESEGRSQQPLEFLVPSSSSQVRPRIHQSSRKYAKTNFNEKRENLMLPLLRKPLMQCTRRKSTRRRIIPLGEVRRFKMVCPGSMKMKEGKLNMAEVDQ